MLNKTAHLMLIAALLLTAANWFYARRAKAASQLVLRPAPVQIVRTTRMG
jgi:hypothetical protein